VKYRVLHRKNTSDDPAVWVEQIDSDGLFESSYDWYLAEDDKEKLGQKYGAGRFLLLAVEEDENGTVMLMRGPQEIELRAITRFEEAEPDGG
jgi:hypothetical protein